MSLTTNVVSASKARSDFYTLLDDVANKFKRIVITNKGGAKAVLLNPEEVEAWDETIEIMANSKLLKAIAASEEERKSGDVVSEKGLFEELNINSDDLSK